jgi:ferrous iron transport protein B
LNPNKNKHLRIALLGNPNAGKSSLFNALTGLRQKTGNYAGVTVDRYDGQASFDSPAGHYLFNIVDLPGLYSLYPKSQDETIACRTLLDPNEKIEVAVVVLDSTSLKRSLMLATQVIDLKFRTVVVLNMIDEAEKQGIKIDVKGLEKTLGVRVMPVDSRRGQGIEELKEAIASSAESASIFYDLARPLPATDYREYINKAANNEKTASTENADKVYRYNIINYLLVKYVRTPEELSQKENTARIDKVTTHPVFGYVVLLLVIFLVFQFIFYVSEKPMAWIEAVFLQLGGFLRGSLPTGAASDLLIDGVLPGVSGVVMFVPQIAFLFIFIGFLEDSGYMARAGFIMDKVMRPFGLNGRSVIPLISGTACAVPSIMATRSISNIKERLITIFVLPLVSCSARLPVYTLLISVMYPESSFLGIFNTRGVVLFLLYMLGFVATMITAYLLKHIIKSKESSFFVMELPVYRWPHLRNISLMVYNKVKVFVLEAGKVILAISIILWFLSSYGAGEKYRHYTEQEKLLAADANTSKTELESVRSARFEHSFIGTLGRAIEPVISPLGYDWKIGIAILTSFAAREVFVGTMATIYQSSDTDGGGAIRDKLRVEKNSRGQPQFSSAVCWSLLLFYAFALQCMSTVAVVHRETKSWIIVLAQFTFLFLLAYGSAFTAYHLLS